MWGKEIKRMGEGEEEGEGEGEEEGGPGDGSRPSRSLERVGEDR